MSKKAKVFSVVVLFLLMLSSFPSGALASVLVPPPEPKQPARFAEVDSTNFVLLSATYAQKGPVFTFQVNGHVSKADLRAATFSTSSKDFALNCVQKSETTVICSAPKSTAGLSGYIYIAGFGTWVSVPEARDFIQPAIS